MLLAGLLLGACKPEPTAQTVGDTPIAVDIAIATPSTQARSVQLTGRLEAYRTAEIRARVEGIVEQRSYVEGQEVQAGDLLFRIAPEPLQAELSAAEAEQAQAHAAREAAADVARRSRQLMEDDSISAQQYRKDLFAEQQARAAEQSAEAKVRSARLRLAYASVTTPIDGRARRALVTEGALVGEDSPTPLTRVEQIDPIYVNFSQPAGEVAAMQRAIREGQVKGVADKDIAVRLVLADGSEYPLAGELLFSDLAVDPGTDTIAMRALFRNPHRELLPGGYVQVRLQRAVNPQAITVPRDALIRTAQSAVVKVVNPQGVVEDVEVRADTLQGRDWIISRGLKGGERVIVENAAQHAAGSSVQAVVRQPASADAPSPLAASPAGQ
ncbi:MexX/AxyX family multidrug efflux RND transporter periplasmic adaptor subunit [Pseudomonas aeruginosa]|nr:MexX/AxyX family multidrug efflux RND transporter periplasmic adaptor subunit [Pseudomonas aeruginosa]